MDGVIIFPQENTGIDGPLCALKQETDRLMTLISGMSHIDTGVRKTLSGHAEAMFSNVVLAENLARDRNPAFGTMARCQHCLRASENIAMSWSGDLDCLCDEGSALGRRIVSFLKDAGESVYRILETLSEPGLPRGKSSPLIKVNPHEHFLVCETCGALAASFLSGMDFFTGRQYMLYWGERRAVIPDEDAAVARGFLQKKDIGGLDRFFRETGLGSDGIAELCNHCGKIMCRNHRPCRCNN